MYTEAMDGAVLALIVVVVIVIVALFLAPGGGLLSGGGSRGSSGSGNSDSDSGGDSGGSGSSGNGGSGFVGREAVDLAAGYPYNYAVDAAELAENRMYSSAEVDPLITGQLYAGPRAGGVGRRLIYGGRTSHGDKWGLREFSAGVPGQTGVDVGPLGMREYPAGPGGGPDVFDDGIPENWRLPSTPVSWYVPRGRDHYDVEARGPQVYKAGLTSLQEPDHDVLLN